MTACSAMTARDAWKLAGDEMRRFSIREIPTSWDVPIRLGLREAELARADRLAGELETLLPGRFKAVEEAKRGALSPEQKAGPRHPAHRPNRITAAGGRGRGGAAGDLADGGP
jgi:hypothetical protein